jgi:hypothetical protein
MALRSQQHTQTTIKKQFPQAESYKNKKTVFSPHQTKTSKTLQNRTLHTIAFTQIKIIRKLFA